MKYLLFLFTLTIAYTANVNAQSADKITFGSRLICALDDIGGVDCVTGDGFTRLQPPSNTPALTTISAGDVHVCGITQAGAAVCWGDNDFGQLDAPQDVQFISMSSGTNLSCGVATDNSVVCWGLNTHGETEPANDIGYTQTTHDNITSCGLQFDGKISCWGKLISLPDRFTEHTFTKIDINRNAICGVTDQNDVRCNFSSQEILGNMIDVALSDNLFCGLSVSGDITCRTNFLFEPWQNHLAARIAEINSGPNVIALYGDSTGSNNRSNRVCYELDTGEFGCIVREIFSAPVLPGDQANTPEAAQNLSADVYSDSTVELVWTAPFNIAGADIYRNGELLATTPNRSSFVDDTLIPGVLYEYSVALFFIDGVRSALSTSTSVTTGQASSGMDTGYTPVDRPAEPTGLTAVIYNPNEIELFWERLTTLPNDFNGYEIWRNHEFIAFTRGISFYDNTVQPNSTYHYDIVAVERDGTILGFNGIDVNTGDN